MMADEKELFQMELEKLISLPLQRKKAWVDKVEAAITLHEDRDRSSMQQSRRLFRAWLQGANQGHIGS